MTLSYRVGTSGTMSPNSRLETRQRFAVVVGESTSVSSASACPTTMSSSAPVPQTMLSPSCGAPDDVVAVCRGAPDDVVADRPCPTRCCRSRRRRSRCPRRCCRRRARCPRRCCRRRRACPRRCCRRRRWCPTRCCRRRAIEPQTMLSPPSPASSPSPRPRCCAQAFAVRLDDAARQAMAAPDDLAAPHRLHRHAVAARAVRVELRQAHRAERVQEAGALPQRAVAADTAARCTAGSP